MEKLDGKYKERLALYEKQRSENRRLWNIGEETVRFLSLLLKIHQPKNILEIGTSNGYSAFRMLLATVDFDSKLESIECDRARYELATQNLNLWENVILHFGKAEEIIPTLKKKYDFVFIDANKEQYSAYLDLLRPKLTIPALIVADNTLSHKHSVRQYLTQVRTYPHFFSISIPLESGLEVTLYKPTIQL